MPYQSCAVQLSPIGVGCGEETQAGFTGRGVAAVKSNVSITRTGRSVQSITSSAQGDITSVDNAWVANAFDGTNLALNVENGRKKYTKQVQVRIPRDPAHPEEAAIMAENLASVPFVFVLEREDGTYPVYGAQGKLIATATTQAENASDGDYVVTLECTEGYSELLLVDDPDSAQDPQTAAQKFAALWAEGIQA